MSALANRDLTEKQFAFVRATVAGIPPGPAAVEAGYENRDSARHLLALPHVVAAIHIELQRALVSEAAPAAFKVIRELMSDSATPARTRADLALKVMTMSGHGVQPGGKDQHNKPLNEMSPDELREYIDRNQAEIDRIEAELAARAKDVTAPMPSQIDAKPLNYLE